MNPEPAIKAAIDDHGPITFAEFMQLALYGHGGYYTSGSPISASGDYFTAPSAHPLFGALIAVQLRQMWQLLGSPDEFTVVEEGAGSGGLAADITGYTATLDSKFASALDYISLDIAPPGRQHYPVLPLTAAPVGITGCLLSNELLDAMPVHRFEVRDGKVQEVFITSDSGNLAEVLLAPSSPEIERRLRPFLSSLPEGYRGEINLDLNPWAERQASTLERGWALAIDYGFDRAGLYRPDRTSGSLRTYYQHTLGQHPLQHAGKQDITAHVDFTAVDEAMAQGGFTAAGSTSQAAFLARLGIESAFEELHTARLPRQELRANEVGIRALIDLDGMGRFIVAAYSRNIDNSQLSGFSSNSGQPAHRVTKPPLLNPQRHINLITTQQSGAYFEVQSLEDLFSDEP